MDEMGWGQCGEGRQEMRGSGCGDECEIGKQV